MSKLLENQLNIAVKSINTLVEHAKKAEADRKKAEAKAEADRKKAEAKAEADRKEAEAKAQAVLFAVQNAAAKAEARAEAQMQMMMKNHEVVVAKLDHIESQIFQVHGRVISAPGVTAETQKAFNDAAEKVSLEELKESETFRDTGMLPNPETGVLESVTKTKAVGMKKILAAFMDRKPTQGESINFGRWSNKKMDQAFGRNFKGFYGPGLLSLLDILAYHYVVEREEKERIAT
jgi:uncharacterized membrane protein YqiK